MHHRAAAWPETQVEKVRKLIMVGRGGKWLGTATGATRPTPKAGWLPGHSQHLLRADFYLLPCCLVTRGQSEESGGGRRGRDRHLGLTS